MELTAGKFATYWEDYMRGTFYVHWRLVLTLGAERSLEDIIATVFTDDEY